MLVAIPAVFYVAMRILWETSGEVAAVRTFDAAGEAHDTHLWIVDVGGHAYLRTGNANAKWLARMREHPAIEVTRHGVTANVVACRSTIQSCAPRSTPPSPTNTDLPRRCRAS